MTLYHIYFSPTGGTKKVADILANALSMDTIEINLLSRETDYSQFSFQKEDVCLISVPSYVGRVPETALSRLTQMKADRTSTILTAVFGNRAIEDTLLELGDALTPLGFHPIAAVSAVAEHSIMHQFGVGRPDADDEKDLLSFAEAIKNRLLHAQPLPSVALPGNRPYREFHTIPLVPETDEGCAQCGVCANHCPVGAIPTATPFLTDKELCIRCMGCISVCPKGIRKLNPLMLQASVQNLRAACEERKHNTLFLP